MKKSNIKNLRKVDFSGKDIYVGLDVHKKTWYASFAYGETLPHPKSFPPDPEKLYNYLVKNYPGANYHLVYEAGGSGFWICEKLNKLNINTIVVNPADIPTTDKDCKNKTDKRDSKTLAKMLQSGLLKGIYVHSPQTLEDRSLVRDRSDLVRKQTRIKNQIKSKLTLFGIEIAEQFSEPSSHWSASFIKWLENIHLRTASGTKSLQVLVRQLKYYRGEILAMTREIRALSRMERYKKHYGILISCPGIGLVSAMTLLTEIECIRRFKTMGQLLSFIGLVPTERSSGERQRKGNLTKRRNHNLRNIIIEASWVAKRSDPALTEYFESSCIRMKKQKAIIKVGRKLISRIYLIWAKEEEYVKGVA